MLSTAKQNPQSTTEHALRRVEAQIYHLFLTEVLRIAGSCSTAMWQVHWSYGLLYEF